MPEKTAISSLPMTIIHKIFIIGLPHKQKTAVISHVNVIIHNYFTLFSLIHHTIITFIT